MDSKSYVQKLRLSNTSKLKAEKISSFSIPAYKTISGIITCIGALFCIALCYARQGTYTWSSVKALRESNYFLSLESNFVASMKSLLQSYKNDILRLHDSGDFYSTEYYAKWCEICSSFPMKTFYAYTKSLSIIDIELKPKNLVLIQSYGGKFDNLINLKYPICKAFLNEEDLLKEGFINCSKSDLLAIHTAAKGNMKIGLVYHGVKKGSKGKFIN